MDIQSILASISNNTASVTKTVRSSNGGGGKNAIHYALLPGKEVETAILSTQGAVKFPLMMMLWHTTLLPVNKLLANGECPMEELCKGIESAHPWILTQLKGLSLYEKCEEVLLQDTLPMEEVNKFINASALLDSTDPETAEAHTARLNARVAIEASVLGIQNPWGFGVDRTLESFTLYDIGIGVWASRAIQGEVGKASNIKAYVRTPLLDNNPVNKLFPVTGPNPKTRIPVLVKVA
jgi:hypothetical protein